MPTNTSRLGLLKHTTADDFRIADYTANWNALDAYPGTYICTSTTRPTTWAAAQAGMAIYETNTKLIWHWNGTSWERNIPKGLLGPSAERLSDLSTTNTAYATVVSTNVTVPAGNRRVLVSVECSGVASTAGLTQFAIFRGTTLLAEYFNKGAVGASAANYPEAAGYTLIDVPTSGVTTYSLQFRTVVGFGGTSTVKATSNSRTAITVVEV